MTSDRYRVVNPDDVAEEFVRLSAIARERGLLRLFVAAGKWILEELARTPHEFGESWHHDPESNLVFRRGFARPLHVQYAIHDAERVVFLRRFSLMR